jgi:hypothetical protein
MGTPFPELVVVSIENPRDFKRQVLEAKQRLVANSSTGQSKNIDITNMLSGANQQDLTRIMDLLSRQLEEKKTPN